jgi:hypothetical protein
MFHGVTILRRKMPHNRSSERWRFAQLPQAMACGHVAKGTMALRAIEGYPYILVDTLTFCKQNVRVSTKMLESGFAMQNAPIEF